MGAFYLWNHHIAPEIVQATQYHNNPEEAPDHPELASAVQLADHLTRSSGIQGIERVDRLKSRDWPKLTGWKILFGEDEIVSDEERIEELEETLDRVTGSLKGIV